MALEGTFNDFGLADILQLIGLQRKTGVFTVRGESGQVVSVSFEKGMVVFADEFKRTEAERLGSLLLRTHLLTSEQLQQAVEVQKTTAQRLGHILIAQQSISQRTLAEALQLQVKETVYRLFRWKEGSYHFSPEPVTFDREIYTPIPAEFVLVEGTRMIDEWPMLEKKIPHFQMVFERVAEPAPPQPVAAKPAAVGIADLMDFDGSHDDSPSGASFEHMGEALGPRENSVLVLVDGRRTVQELIDLSHLGEFETCKVLYGLLSLNMIRARVAPAPPPAGLAPTAPRRGPLAAREYAVVAVSILLLLLAFLFNPWGIVAKGFGRGQGRRESALLVDAVRLRRVRLALEVYFLEKQAYPPALEKLTENKLLPQGELRGAAGASFHYHGSGHEYSLEREAKR